MWNFDYSNVNAISELLKDAGLSMTKKFGQNFLISTSSLDKITSVAGVTENAVVWEIGPGIGALTSKLLAKGAKVTAFEIDHGFCRILRDVAFKDEKNFTLIEGDALKTWKEVYKTDGTPDIICANLPYNVGSVLIASFIENRMLANTMVYTLQSEVVQRICATKGSDQYSGFSILVSADYENKEVLKLKSSCFWPAPNVDSGVVLMKKKNESFNADEKFFVTLRALFAQRRKTIKNNLKSVTTSEKIGTALSALGIKENERAENLTGKQIYDISRLI